MALSRNAITVPQLKSDESGAAPALSRYEMVELAKEFEGVGNGTRKARAGSGATVALRSDVGAAALATVEDAASRAELLVLAVDSDSRSSNGDGAGGCGAAAKLVELAVEVEAALACSCLTVPSSATHKRLG